jgi:hypothetical protein
MLRDPAGWRDTASLPPISATWLLTRNGLHFNITQAYKSGHSSGAVKHVICAETLRVGCQGLYEGCCRMMEPLEFLGCLHSHSITDR